MDICYRVFGQSAAEPDRSGLAAVALSFDPRSQVEFQEGAFGWQQARLLLPTHVQELTLCRHRREEEGVVRELQAWSAWAEAEQRPELMQAFFSAQQVLTTHTAGTAPDSPVDGFLTGELLPWLADCVEGVYQVDNQGVFDKGGSLLLRENG
jgi:hypothetical protein